MKLKEQTKHCLFFMFFCKIATCYYLLLRRGTKRSKSCISPKNVLCKYSFDQQFVNDLNVSYVLKHTRCQLEHNPSKVTEYQCYHIFHISYLFEYWLYVYNVKEYILTSGICISNRGHCHVSPDVPQVDTLLSQEINKQTVSLQVLL